MSRPNVNLTVGSMLANISANVGQLLENHVGPTPTSKITMAQRWLPTMAQHKMYGWPNVGLTRNCYQG